MVKESLEVVFLLNNNFKVENGEPFIKGEKNYGTEHLNALKRPEWLSDKKLKIPPIQYI